jgi:hypothetical protein
MVNYDSTQSGTDVWGSSNSKQPKETLRNGFSRDSPGGPNTVVDPHEKKYLWIIVNSDVQYG